MEKQTDINKPEADLSPENAVAAKATTKPKKILPILIIGFLVLIAILLIVLILVLSLRTNQPAGDKTTDNSAQVVVTTSPTVEITATPSVTTTTTVLPSNTSQPIATSTPSPTYPPLEIKNVNIFADLYCYETAGRAEHTFNISGTIWASYPGTVTYKWIHPTRLTTTETLVFTGVNQVKQVSDETITLSIGEFQASTSAQIILKTFTPSEQYSGYITVMIQNTEAGGDCI